MDHSRYHPPTSDRIEPLTAAIAGVSSGWPAGGVVDANSPGSVSNR